MTDDPLGAGPVEPLGVTVCRPLPTVAVLRLSGSLDLASAPVLDRYLVEQAATDPAHLVLDLAAVGFLAAAGLGPIMQVRRALHGRGRVHLTGVVGNRVVERVLELTDVRSVVEVDDDLDALLAALDA
ncbi:STAS domain-containing protein [Pseudonocardia lacus]|uniref:STAS domain-containing protein n=1 Tax=Pseudonocardia lacus TaxID=2835865 RepID=UPI001BDD2BE0|nr:STAS domain-containing protein [Pseudonocardia lacus]